MKSAKILLLTVVAATLPLLLLVNPGRAVTIDFSSIGECDQPCPLVINSTAYVAQGVVFTIATGVDQVQGEQALIDFGNSIAGNFTAPMLLSSLSVRVAPAAQGTTLYTLTAFDVSLAVAGSTSLQVTEDFGDPQNMGFGYVTLLLDQFSGPVSSFAITNTFIRSSFGNQSAGFGMATLSFDAAATPLPATLPLFATGLGALGLFGWRRKRAASQ